MRFCSQKLKVLESCHWCLSSPDIHTWHQPCQKPARKAPCETTTPPVRLGGIRIAWSDGPGHLLGFDKHSNKEVRFWHGWRF